MMVFILYLMAAVAAVIFGIWLVYHFVNKAGENGVMEDAALTLEQKVDNGYIGVPGDLNEYVGCEGIALTVLRPAGKVKLGEEIIDAVSVKDFIEENATVKVVKCENSQLYVLKK